MSNQKEIIKQWKKFGWQKKTKEIFGKKMKLVETQIECLKNSREKTSIWKLYISDQVESIPIVLKIYKTPLNENHIVELNMYEKVSQILKEFMPRVYWLERNVNNEEIWMFIEYIEPLRGQIKLKPEHYNFIIPTVAKFHAQTFEHRFSQHTDIFEPWLPNYHLDSMAMERKMHIEKTLEYLDLAMKDSKLNELIAPCYDILQQIYKKGPNFFPQVFENGNSLIHGDMHIHNISCHNAMQDQNWQIKLIDWESAKYSPVWFDLVVLIEILIDFRGDWHKDAEEIRKHCMKLYQDEMKKYGITFHIDPLQLLKMAYLQRTLEKRLLNHIRRVLRGEKSILLPRYLEKIIVWGKELDLY